MNRPKYEDYECSKECLVARKYVEDLEQYCDELEQKICDLQETIKDMEEERIERADLDLEEMYGEDW